MKDVFSVADVACVLACVFDRLARSSIIVRRLKRWTDVSTGVYTSARLHVRYEREENGEGHVTFLYHALMCVIL